MSRITRITQDDIAAIRMVFVGGVEQGALQAESRQVWTCDAGSHGEPERRRG
jgi:hypothetical protein